MEIPPATRATMYFIGVSTPHSSMMRIFPRWCEALKIEADLVGLDFVPNDDPARYRSAVEQIKADPLARGALITTHKLDLLRAARDCFDRLEPLAATLDEVSCIYKNGNELTGAAVDAATSRIALEAFLPPNHWQASNAEVLILGAGGAAIATAWQLRHPDAGANRPRRVMVTDLSKDRLHHFAAIQDQLPNEVPLECRQIEPGPSDDLLAELPPGSLVINATGMGKDRPGSPLSNAARFPRDGLVWEFNYRGERQFLQQALAQQSERRLIVEDGWNYFLHGWMQVIGKVFHQPIPGGPDQFEQLARLAGESPAKSQVFSERPPIRS